SWRWPSRQTWHSACSRPDPARSTHPTSQPSSRVPLGLMARKLDYASATSFYLGRLTFNLQCLFGTAIESQGPIQHLFHERHAIELHQLHVLLDAAIKREPNLPRPREHLRIVDRRFVLQMVRRNRREPLGDLQHVAVVIADAIQPGVGVEVRRLDDE